MLFEKELQNQLVPEWRAKYLDYKTAKKRLNACENALRKANQSPNGIPSAGPKSARRGSTVPNELLSASTTPYPAFLEPSIEEQRRYDINSAAENASQALQRVRSRRDAHQAHQAANEQQPLRGASGNRLGDSGGTYGSLESKHNKSHGGSPLRNGTLMDHDVSPGTSPKGAAQPETYDSGGQLRRSQSDGAPSLKLPGPAIAESIKAGIDHGGHSDLARMMSVVHPSFAERVSKSPLNGAAQESRETPRRILTTPSIPSHRPHSLFKRYFSRQKATAQTPVELPLEVYRDFDAKRADFFSFLEKQLAMVSDFYKDKEDQAVERFEMLEEQLNLLKQYQTKKADAAAAERRTRKYRLSIGMPADSKAAKKDEPLAAKLKNKIADNIPFRPTFPSHTKNSTESIHDPLGAQVSRSANSAVKDYTRKTNDQVPYTEARSKLKHALQEFYRNLEMLKSYSMLNREAFRKIIKKYDKTISARHAGKFMSEKVDQAWFVKSDVVDTLMASTENSYAHFEKSHKMAATKLRAKHNIDYSPCSFRNGMYLGAGTVISLRALIWASDLFYHNPDPRIVLETSFLLQIYGGYFLVLFLFLAFCIDCRFWANNRISYPFIFEFDPRSRLDWRQLAEIPSLLFLVMGILMWTNFGPYGGGPSSTLWLYYPVILAGISVGIVFFPFRGFPIIYPRIKAGRLRLYRTRLGFLYPHSRAWFAFSNFRLYTGGIYPVEFRDFFLGDMYCSLTYAMGNIELFFCLYITGWQNPPVCNSSNSMLFGFFTCLPGVWRALQCLRRYKDSRMAFPHLANFGKYICTILFYMTLSLYRLDETPLRKAIFIAFATINSIYVSIWDVCFDWSLGTHGSRGLLYADAKGRNQQFGFPTWYYYPAVVLDPLLRFNWVFYAFIYGELQHSAMLSFFVALTEIFRRSFWALFRVENEHMTNVGMFRASRDAPLPYELRSSRSSSSDGPSDLESQAAEIMSTPRRVVTAIAGAHTHDFERKKPAERHTDDEDDEDDDDDDDGGSMAENRHH